VAGQAGDLLTGTWAVNVAKSTYSPGPAPKSETRTYVALANGYKFSSKGIDGEGKPTATTFSVNFDGKYYPLTGSVAVDSIMAKRVDAYTNESVQTKGGKIVRRTTRVIAKDGKSFTVTSTGTNAAGKPYKNVEVFDKK
jgi:hypothetical protein